MNPINENEKFYLDAANGLDPAPVTRDQKFYKELVENSGGGGGGGSEQVSFTWDGSSSTVTCNKTLQDVLAMSSPTFVLTRTDDNITFRNVSNILYQDGIEIVFLDMAMASVENPDTALLLYYNVRNSGNNWVIVNHACDLSTLIM